MKKLACLSIIIMAFAILKACSDNLSFNSPFDAANDNFLPSAPKFIMVEDFDDGNYINLWGRSEFSFEEGGNLDRHLILHNLQPMLSGKGYVLEIRYDVSANLSAVGWGQFLIDFSTGTFFNPRILGINTFSFWVRGEKGGEKFFIKLADSSKAASIPTTELLKSVTTNWQKVLVPLGLFEEAGLKISQLRSYEFTFKNNNIPQNGTIYVDNIAFEH